ncbi:hypothetical protein ASG31_08865 [Chryseobacterium sp. Leaf404]|uniref:hypothetical protein n=1 Tax=unclassified Chryseobacterium TaxID=2593645 RepID=UPI0006FACCD0|nr:MULTISPECIES: hypothetical protein [unclassified Chryseobacterium]KQT17508.1 hypothetical protein ASG31_08865 [Chryseobacterium sp. Leaf404]
MKRKNLILFMISFIALSSCTNKLFNYALTKKGIYDEKISVSKFNFKDKQIVFFPMHHIGTQNFYSDVNTKIDSLQKLGFFFYLENVTSKSSDKQDLMKLRKIMGMGLPNGGYEKILDSIMLEKNLKFTKEIKFQPAYADWRLNSINSKNVDATVPELIKFYESKYGEIKLEECDLNTPDITNSTKCSYRKNERKAYQILVLNYRNNLIANKINDNSKQKIALIYGAGHYDGIKKLLDSLEKQ